MTLKEKLSHKFVGAGRIAVLGIGSTLRADDAAGVLIAESLAKCLKKHVAASRVKIFIGATAPENLTGALKEFKPTHLVIVDAADAGKKPGTIVMLAPHELRGTSFCTHQLPLYIMVDYLLKSFECNVIILGIQPRVLTFGKPVSACVTKAIREIVSSFLAALS